MSTKKAKTTPGDLAKRDIPDELLPLVEQRLARLAREQQVHRDMTVMFGGNVGNHRMLRQWLREASAELAEKQVDADRLAEVGNLLAGLRAELADLRARVATMATTPKAAPAKAVTPKAAPHRLPGRPNGARSI